MIAAHLDPMGADARGSEPMAGDDSGGPMTQTSLEVRSMFGSIAAECATSMAGSIHPSSDDTICSGPKPGADRVVRGRVDGPRHGGRILSGIGAEHRFHL